MKVMCSTNRRYEHPVLTAMTDSRNLKALLATEKPLVIPGVYDGLSATLAVQSGFECIYLSGFCVAGTMLGSPDIGLVTATEMAERARQVVAASRVPVVADGDNGHGGPMNVERLVHLYERAGVACIQLEDQAIPKRCGHLDAKQVISLEEAKAKIRMAADCRGSADFLVMARTDALATHGMDEGLRRADAYLSAGADILFVEAPGSIEELEQIADHFKGQHLVANMVEDGKTPYLSPQELAELGFNLVLYPVSALLSAAKALHDCYLDMKNGFGSAGFAHRLSFGEFNERVDLPGMLERSKRYQ
jgi:2-methylisocitrate lyase-like PEP mutase family enzyme